jgi:predicted GNAT family acetyltransferase
MWFKKLIEKFLGKQPEPIKNVTITSVDKRHEEAEQFTLDVEEITQKIKEDMEVIKERHAPKLTVDQLMAMTKKEQLAYAEENGVAVKPHWTKKNIATEIVSVLS